MLPFSLFCIGVPVGKSAVEQRKSGLAVWGPLGCVIDDETYQSMFFVGRMAARS